MLEHLGLRRREVEHCDTSTHGKAGRTDSRRGLERGCAMLMRWSDSDCMHACSCRPPFGLTAVEVELIGSLLDDSTAVVERHGRACRVDCGDDRGAVKLLALGWRTESVSTRRRQREQRPDPSATDAHRRQTDRRTEAETHRPALPHHPPPAVPLCSSH